MPDLSALSSSGRVPAYTVVANSTAGSLTVYADCYRRLQCAVPLNLLTTSNRHEQLIWVKIINYIWMQLWIYSAELRQQAFLHLGSCCQSRFHWSERYLLIWPEMLFTWTFSPQHKIQSYPKQSFNFLQFCFKTETRFKPCFRLFWNKRPLNVEYQDTVSLNRHLNPNSSYTAIFKNVRKQFLLILLSISSLSPNKSPIKKAFCILNTNLVSINK